MHRNPAQVLEEFYAAEAEYVASGGRGIADFGPLSRCLDPDVIVRQAPGLPFSGTGEWTGHEGVQLFMEAFADTWRSLEILHHKVIAGDDSVVVQLEVRFESAKTGVSFTTSIVQVNTVREGLIVEIRPYYWDPDGLARACAFQ